MARRRTGRKRNAPVTLGKVVLMEVDNPHYSRAHDGDKTNPRTITACYNPSESYVVLLYTRKTITQAEGKAADRIRAAWEGMGGAGARAMDYSKLVVDGGMSPDPLTERQQEYGRQLKDAALRLGPQGYDLVIKLAGQGLYPKDLATTRRQQDYIGQRFQECLETLAVHWGLQKSRMRSWRDTA